VEASVGTEFLVMNCIVKVFKKLTDNKFDLNHLSTIMRLALCLVSKILGLLSMTIRLVSSAKRTDKATSCASVVLHLHAQALQANKMAHVIENYSKFDVCVVVRFLQAEGARERFIAG
jgi:hypothetical protein